MGRVVSVDPPFFFFCLGSFGFTEFGALLIDDPCSHFLLALLCIVRTHGTFP